MTRMIIYLQYINVLWCRYMHFSKFRLLILFAEWVFWQRVFAIAASRLSFFVDELVHENLIWILFKLTIFEDRWWFWRWCLGAADAAGGEDGAFAWMELDKTCTSFSTSFLWQNKQERTFYFKYATCFSSLRDFMNFHPCIFLFRLVWDPPVVVVAAAAAVILIGVGA